MRRQLTKRRVLSIPNENWGSLNCEVPGQENGGTIVDVLCGEANSPGRFRYTIPKQPADYNFV